MQNLPPAGQRPPPPRVHPCPVFWVQVGAETLRTGPGSRATAPLCSRGSRALDKSLMPPHKAPTGHSGTNSQGAAFSACVDNTWQDSKLSTVPP